MLVKTENDIQVKIKKSKPFMIADSKVWDTIIKVLILFAWLVGLSFFGVDFFYQLFSLEWSRYLAQFLVYIMMIAPVILLKNLDRISNEEIGLSFSKFWQQIVIGISVAIILYSVPFLISLLSINSIKNLAQSWAMVDFLLDIMMQFLIVGMVEEYIFRGYIQTKFRQIFERIKWVSPIIQGALFAAWHFRVTWLTMLFIFAIGLVFGFLREYLKTAKLPTLVIAHGLYNSLYVIVPIIIGLLCK